MGIPLPRFRHFCLLLIAIAAVVGVSCRDTQRFGAASVPVAYPACVNLEAGADATPGTTQCGPVSGVLPVANGGTGNAGGGATPLISSWAQIPGCVAYWVCDLGLVLGDSGTGGFTWTDQVGGVVLTQTINADQLTYVPNWANAHCALQGTNGSSSIVMESTTFTSLGYPYAVLAVIEPTTASPSTAVYPVNMGAGASGFGLRQNSGALAPSCYDGTVLNSANSMVINQLALVGCMFGGVNDGGQVTPETIFMLKGQYYDNSATGSRSTVANGIAIGGLQDGGQGFGGYISMIGVFNVVLNQQYKLQAEAVAQSYYGNPF